MERTPTFLAALASAGVPGLDPVSVEALPSVPDQDYDVAFVQDSEHRRWVVRAPRSEAAGARMDLTVTLLQMLARRLPFTIPSPRGFVELKGGGRAMVYPYLPGHNLAFDELPPGAGPAAELGRALAALHNTDVRLFDEAGMPSYDADAYRRRRLAELDRAAESGRVPTALLARWEHALEDVALWRFAPTCVHGDLTGDQVLAVFEDESDASTGRIRGLTGWEDAKVADPADDFAALVDEAGPATVETVLEAYAHARVERPDPNLLVRARLAAELNVLAELMRADARGDQAAVEGFSVRLRQLDDEVHAEDAADDYRRTSLTPVALRGRATPPPVVADEDDEELDLEPVMSTDTGAVESPNHDGDDTGADDDGAEVSDGEAQPGDPVSEGDVPEDAMSQDGPRGPVDDDPAGELVDDDDTSHDDMGHDIPADGYDTGHDDVGRDVPGYENGSHDHPGDEDESHVDPGDESVGHDDPEGSSGGQPLAEWHEPDDDDEVTWAPRSFDRGESPAPRVTAQPDVSEQGPPQAER